MPYSILGVAQGDAYSLQREYTKADQRLIKLGIQQCAPWYFWNADNAEFVCRRVVEAIRARDETTLSEEEKEWFPEILWFWNHHCISWAIWVKRDKSRAQEYATEALSLQHEGHPNRITRLLFLLVYDQLEEARAWVDATVVDRETAEEILADYKVGGRLWPLSKA